MAPPDLFDPTKTIPSGLSFPPGFAAELNASLAFYGADWRWSWDNNQGAGFFLTGPYAGKYYNTAPLRPGAIYNGVPVPAGTLEWSIFNQQPGTGGTITCVLGPDLGQTIKDETGLNAGDLGIVLGFLAAPFTAGASLVGDIGAVTGATVSSVKATTPQPSVQLPVSPTGVVPAVATQPNAPINSSAPASALANAPGALGLGGSSSGLLVLALAAGLVLALRRST